jgi:hypothetical protein
MQKPHFIKAEPGYRVVETIDTIKDDGTLEPWFTPVIGWLMEHTPSEYVDDSYVESFLSPQRYLRSQGQRSRVSRRPGLFIMTKAITIPSRTG